MTLTTEQLDTIAWRLDQQRQSRSFASTDGGSLLRAVRSELHRRKHGPFTLAEAIASGRPFRRKGCPIWVKPAPSTEEGPQWLHQRGGGDWLPYLVDTATGWLEEANEFNSDDITATDYELMPKGGE